MSSGVQLRSADRSSPVAVTSNVWWNWYAFPGTIRTAEMSTGSERPFVMSV